MSWAVFLKYNLKILFRNNFLAGMAYGLVVPFIFNLSNSLAISEVYLSPLGIILLTQLPEVDREDGIQELVAVRKKGSYYNFLSRFLLGLILTITMLTWFMGYLTVKGIGYNPVEMFFGTMITALFLGTIGITVSNILKNYVAGYIVSFTYYLFEMMTAGKYTGEFYLFSLTQGKLTPKYYLLGISILLVGFNLFYLSFRRVD